MFSCVSWISSMHSCSTSLFMQLTTTTSRNTEKSIYSTQASCSHGFLIDVLQLHLPYLTWADRQDASYLSHAFSTPLPLLSTAPEHSPFQYLAARYPCRWLAFYLSLFFLLLVAKAPICWPFLQCGGCSDQQVALFFVALSLIHTGVLCRVLCW